MATMNGANMSSSPKALSEGSALRAPASDGANRLMDRSRFANIIGKSKCLLELFESGRGICQGERSTKTYWQFVDFSPGPCSM